MSPGWSPNKIRDYTSIFNAHLMRAFGDLPFSQIRPIFIKKFLAKLISHRKPNEEPLSGKRIQNINIPLRAIV